MTKNCFEFRMFFFLIVFKFCIKVINSKWYLAGCAKSRRLVFQTIVTSRRRAHAQQLPLATIDHGSGSVVRNGHHLASKTPAQWGVQTPIFCNYFCAHLNVIIFFIYEPPKLTLLSLQNTSRIAEFVTILIPNADNATMQHSSPHYGALLTCFCIIVICNICIFYGLKNCSLYIDVLIVTTNWVQKKVGYPSDIFLLQKLSNVFYVMYKAVTFNIQYTNRLELLASTGTL